MQILSAKISNLLSFPYLENSLEETISFSIEKKGGVHVFIGPNGSGKTNMLNILAQLLNKALIQDAIYTPDHTEQTKVITGEYTPLLGMKPHFTYTNKPSTVDITLHISEGDKENLLYLQKKREIYNSILSQYSSTGYQIPVCDYTNIHNLEKIRITFAIDTEQQTAHITNTQTNCEEQFAVEYFRYFEIFQICGIHHNTKQTGELLLSLKNTFGILKGKRDFDALKNEEIDPKLRRNYLSNKQAPNQHALLGYALCMRKFEHLKIIHPEIPLEQTHFFLSLAEQIKKYMEYDLIIIPEPANKHEKLAFKDESNNIFNIHTLSHGEQSLLAIIFTVYGYDLKEGLLMIDEPEIHFHPQMQKRLIRMLEKLNENTGVQCIISTYSPIFINEKNISNVYRFSKTGGNTIIRSPGNHINDDDAGLVQILKFENAAKIFFVDRILMVEGETDAYFFEFYLNYLHTLPERKPILKNYEIININGKGEYKRREKFLKKFGIKTAFIGDWDNIVDYDFMTQNELNSYYKQAKNYYSQHRKAENHERAYTKLVITIKELYPHRYATILENITELYKRNVFILKRGDIETYLGMKSKGVQETITFCHQFFHLWLKNKELQHHKEELEDILKKIFIEQQ